MATFRTPTGRTFSVADFDVALYVAVTLPENVEVTPTVVMVKVPVVAPARTVMLAGTVAFVLVFARVTRAPPPGATALSVTVPVTLLPPGTVLGESASLMTVGS